MHARRFACFVLGLWLAGGLFVAWLSSLNLQTADRLVAQASPTARLELKVLGPNARALLRYQASEANRRYYRQWETAQIMLGCAFLALMLFGSQESKFLLAGILLLVLMVVFQRFVVTPAFVAQGRLLDFASPGATSGEHSQYLVLAGGYYGVEGVKWLLILILTGWMVFSRKGSGRSRDSRRQFNGVDKPNYGRVNR
jgi:hypothetical protein